MTPLPLTLRLTTALGIALLGGIAGSTAARAESTQVRPPLHAAKGGSAMPRLIATFVHAEQERSLAILSIDGGPSQTLRVGQTLSSGEQVHQISRSYIVLAQGATLSTLPLRGSGTARKPPPRSLPGNIRNTAHTSSPSAATANGVSFSAENLNNVRAACSDPAMIGALSDAQRAELDALGVCNPG